MIKNSNDNASSHNESINENKIIVLNTNIQEKKKDEQTQHRDIDNDNDYEDEDDDSENYKLNSEIIALANEVSKVFGKNNNNNEFIKPNNNDNLDSNKSYNKITSNDTSTRLYQSINESNHFTSNEFIKNNIIHDDNDDNFNDNNDDLLINIQNINEENYDSLLPDFDWDNLEAKLKQGSHNAQNNNNSERDEIRRKLAASKLNEADDYIPDYLKKSKNQKSHIGQNLQICFINESISDCENSNESNNIENNNSKLIITNTTVRFTKHKIEGNKNDLKSSFTKQYNHSNLLFKPLFTRQLSNSQNMQNMCSNENVISYIQKLQEDTKLALINAEQEAKTKINMENKIKKASPIADIVGLATYGVKKLDKRMLNDMNIGQLQVIANDLYNQIENTNERLKYLLIDRDELYMQQDSILVDIEDLTKRLQEYSEKINYLHDTNNNNNTTNENTNETLTTPSTVKSIQSPKALANNTINNITNSSQNLLRKSAKLFQISSITNKLLHK